MSEPPIVKTHRAPRPAPPPVVQDARKTIAPAGEVKAGADDSGFGRNAVMKNRGLMLLMLFGVTAALGIPFLWMSKAFSRNEKIVWSIIVSVYTVIILWLFFLIMSWSYSRISNSLGW